MRNPDHLIHAAVQKAHEAGRRAALDQMFAQLGRVFAAQLAPAVFKAHEGRDRAEHDPELEVDPHAALLLAQIDHRIRCLEEGTDPDKGDRALHDLWDDPDELAALLAPHTGGDERVEKALAYALFVKAAEHAPKGGISLGGTFYPGGRWIPAAKVASASPEEKRELAERKQGARPNPLNAREKAKAASEAKRGDRATLRKRVAEIATDIMMHPDARTPDHYRDLAEALRGDHLTVADLRAMRLKLSASFGGKRRRDEMVAALLEHATRAEKGLRDERASAEFAAERERNERRNRGQKPKRPTAKGIDSILSKVIDYGGIDPTSHEFLTSYEGVRQAQQDNIPLIAFRRGGRGLDQIARELEANGHIHVPENEHPGSYVLDLLRERAVSLTADLTKEYDKAYDEYVRAREEAERFAGPDRAEEVGRSGAQAGFLEGAQNPLGEYGAGAGEVATHDDTADGLTDEFVKWWASDSNEPFVPSKTEGALGGKSATEPAPAHEAPAPETANAALPQPSSSNAPSDLSERHAGTNHAPTILQIPKGDSRFVAGHRVRHTADGNFQVERRGGFLTGSAAQVSDHIRNSWKDNQGWKSLPGALARAHAYDEPDPFTDVGRAAEDAKARSQIPDGTRAVSLDENTHGRVGTVKRNSETGQIHLQLDGGEEAKANDFEPLHAEHSWRVPQAERDKLKPKGGATGDLFGSADEPEPAPKSLSGSAMDKVTREKEKAAVAAAMANYKAGKSEGGELFDSGGDNLFNQSEAGAPAPSPPNETPKGGGLADLPSGIRDQLTHHVGWLKNHAENLERARALDKKFGGEGRYESEVHEKIDRTNSDKFLKQFRELATKNNIDAERAIQEAGGVPDLSLSSEGQSWRDDQEATKRDREKRAAKEGGANSSSSNVASVKPFSVGDQLKYTGRGAEPNETTEFRGFHNDPNTGEKMARVIFRPKSGPPFENSVKVSDLQHAPAYAVPQAEPAAQAAAGAPAPEPAKTLGGKDAGANGYRTAQKEHAQAVYDAIQKKLNAGEPVDVLTSTRRTRINPDARHNLRIRGGEIEMRQGKQWGAVTGSVLDRLAAHVGAPKSPDPSAFASEPAQEPETERAPYEMTPDEFKSVVDDDLKGDADRIHRQSIQNALAGGFSVPSHVLAHYPDLADKPAATLAPAPKLSARSFRGSAQDHAPTEAEFAAASGARALAQTPTADIPAAVAASAPAPAPQPVSADVEHLTKMRDRYKRLHAEAKAELDRAFPEVAKTGVRPTYGRGYNDRLKVVQEHAKNLADAEAELVAASAAGGGAPPDKAAEPPSKLEEGVGAAPAEKPIMVSGYSGYNEFKMPKPVAPNVSPDHVPLATAQGAYRNSSWHPERRGYQEQADYVNQMNADWEHLSKYADTPDKQAQLKEEFERYRQGYLSKHLARLHATGRTASSMTTGPSKFPVAQNRKRLESEHKRSTEHTEFRDRALKAIQKKLRPEAGAIQSNDPNAVSSLERKLESMQRDHAHWKAINAAHKAFLKDPKSLDAADLPEDVKRSIRNYKSQYSWEPHPIAPYQFTNHSANMRRVQSRIEELKKMQSADAKSEGWSGGVRVEESPEDARIRIKFPGKPTREMIDTLKSRGFRWSPSVGAWQRHLNNGGRYAVESVLKQHGHTLESGLPVSPEADDTIPEPVVATAEQPDEHDKPAT